MFDSTYILPAFNSVLSRMAAVVCLMQPFAVTTRVIHAPRLLYRLLYTIGYALGKRTGSSEHGKNGAVTAALFLLSFSNTTYTGEDPNESLVQSSTAFGVRAVNIRLVL